MKILVTNCTRNSGLAVIRALAAQAYEVIGADDRRLPLGLRSRHASRYEVLPPEDDPQFNGALQELLRFHKVDVLIPLAGSEAVCRHGSDGGNLGQVLLPDPRAYAIVNDKQLLLERCESIGLEVPEQYSLAEAESFLTESGITRNSRKLVVRPRRDIGGGRGVCIIGSVEALHAAYRGVQRELDEPLITGYVPGSDDSNLAVHVLFDRDSRLIAFFALRKLYLWPERVGIAAVAASSHEISLVEKLLPLFRSLRWRGPADAEFKIDQRTGVPRLIEINPRLSGALSFAVECGVNLPHLICRAAMGERLPEVREPAYPEGAVYINAAACARLLLSRLRQRRRVLEVLRRIRDESTAGRVATVYRWSDPAPTLGKLLLELRTWLGPSAG